jgi:hypothetical protein
MIQPVKLSAPVMRREGTHQMPLVMRRNPRGFKKISSVVGSKPSFCHENSSSNGFGSSQLTNSGGLPAHLLLLLPLVHQLAAVITHIRRNKQQQQLPGTRLQQQLSHSSRRSSCHASSSSSTSSSCSSTSAGGSWAAREVLPGALPSAQADWLGWISHHQPDVELQGRQQRLAAEAVGTQQ